MKRNSTSVRWSRRSFVASSAALPLVGEELAKAADNPAKPTHQPAYLEFEKFIAAGNDEFSGEKIAMQIRASLHEAVKARQLPLSASATGFPPCAERYEQIAKDVQSAVYNQRNRALAAGWQQWIASLGKIRRLEFFVLPDEIIRFEVVSEKDDKLFSRVGHWKQQWKAGRLQAFEPVSEEIVSAAEPFFRDVTAAALGSRAAFSRQLSKGIPYWRSRLDPASGIDIYGSNGIAVGDIDGDGADEIYVCQPGGLPNRLLKFGPDHQLIDITHTWGVGLLDDTSTALFLDLRNSGQQDLVVLRGGGPVLYIHQGSRYGLNTDAFRFATRPLGGFTGMSAADFDRDGKLDLYLCCYVYFQSEAQYTYASPYHDAQNGPPNFLFRNRLNADGSGFFEDATAETGMNENNNRFSFAPAWCDFNDDGWPDLFVANDFGRKNLYVNRNGHFRDEAGAAGVEDVGPGMSASWFDYDGDGKADLYVANMWSDAGQRVIRDPHFAPASSPETKQAYIRHTRGNSLYRNRANGTFEDATFAQHAGFGRWAWSACGVDLDNDGQPEIFSTSGMLTNESTTDLMGFFWRQVVAKSPVTAGVAPEYQSGWNAINQFVREEYSWDGHQPNLLHGRRGDRYYDFSGVSGLDFAQDSRAFAVTDIDGDGRPDVILKSRLAPQVRVLQNNCCKDRHSLAIQLEGTKSNRDAIGARVEVDGQTKWLEAGTGFLSQHSKRMIFGLGEASIAGSVQITWPSGTKQTLSKLQAGSTYYIKEGSQDVKSRAYASRPMLTSALPEADNSLRLEDTWLVEPVPFPESFKGPGLLVLTEEAGSTDKSNGVTTIRFANALEDRRRQYEIFRRYLFDWRTSLKLPIAFLLNEEGHAVKVYPGVPAETQWRKDLANIKSHAQFALPFDGQYIVPPQRDFAKYGIAFLLSNYPDQALPYFNQALRRNPGNARVIELVGQIHLEAKRFEKAEEAYKQAIKTGSAGPEAAYGLALALAKQNRLDEARGFFQEAIKERPDYAEAINDLGALYIQQGKIKDAIAAFRYGIQAAPDGDILYLNLGRTFAQLGQYDEARQVMQQLLDRKPDNQTARRALQELSGR